MKGRKGRKGRRGEGGKGGREEGEEGRKGDEQYNVRSHYMAHTVDSQRHHIFSINSGYFSYIIIIMCPSYL